MSFFNEGPQPSINSNNGVRFIDPNPTNQTVNHEDLVMYVKLIARSKGRSIVTADSSEDDLNGEDVFSNVVAETNFTYPEGKSFLDTSWTNIGGGNINLGENLGTFGITNINIEFKSSFMPQITIDFVDVRGSALFEQGPCSPYSFFFHLPYPVFELTVKGYYGKPVTYTLALTKFNTKFNAETGNFESKGDFVGYTYAFLADLPLGYIMASTYMVGGTEILAQKWEKVVTKQNQEGNVDGSKQLDPSKPFTIFDMIVNSKKLETELPKYNNDVGIKQLSQLSKSKQALNDLKQTLTEYQRKIKSISGMKVKEGSGGKKTKFYSDNTANIEKVNEQNKIYIASTPTDSNTFSAGKISSKQNITNSYLKLADEITELDITFDDIKNNSSGFFDSNTNEYYIDTEILLNKIETKTKEVDDKYKAKKKEVQGQLNGVVRQELGFWPSIRNVFTILTTNTEVFLELLANTSAEAEKYHKDEELDGIPLLENKNKTQGSQSSTETNKVKIYPWPTYYGDETLGGETQKNEVEKYPGVNTNLLGWPEVRFVEDFVNALTKLRSDLDRFVSDDTQNEPGFDNFVPITAYETHVMGESRAPNRWIGIEQGIKGLKNLESVWCLMGETAFLLGDYSMINSLSVWKSQLGFDNTWSNTNGPDRFGSNPSIDTTKSNLGRWGDKGFDFTQSNFDTTSGTFKGKISPTTKARMEQWGKVDALNMLSTLGSDEQNELLIQIRGAIESGDKATIKENIKQALKKKYKENYKNRKWSDWKTDVTKDLGLSSEDYISKQNVWDDAYSYVTTNPILSLRFDTNKGIPLNHSSLLTSTMVHPNPHNNLNSGVRLVDNGVINSREINFDTTLIDTLKKRYNEYFGENNNTTTDTTTGGTGKDNTTQQSIYNNSISKLVLKNRPNPKNTENHTKQKPETKVSPYYGYIDGDGISINKNLNILSYDFGKFRTMFYKTYEDAVGLSDSNQIIWDLGSPRFIIDTKENKRQYYNNFISSTDVNGAADAFVQTPLWTLNYPPYKNPLHGVSTLIGMDEIVNINIQTKKHSKNDYTTELINLENGFGNTTRNFATWWGLNQYYTNKQDVSSNKYLLPLAYLTVMSFGFDSTYNLRQKTGHYIPFDGLKSTSTSSFSNFTHSHVVAEPPKSWLLLLGSILWRAKEGGLLNNQYDNLKYTNTGGWNSNDLSVGANDDNDPVWFFHTPLSKPWWLGGSVFAIKNSTPLDKTTYETSLTWNNGVTPKYQRRYVGYDKVRKIDRWTSTVGDRLYNKNVQDFDMYNKPRIIGPDYKPGEVNGGTFGSNLVYKYPEDKSLGWNKFDRNFKKCTKEEVPFFKSTTIINSYPKTLSLTYDDDSEYIDIKKYMKELMFLPTSFKKSLIDYFEKWGSDSGSAFNTTNGWLSTLDSLNWVPGIGLPEYNDNYNSVWKKYDNDYTYQNGYGGYLGKDRITSLLTGEVLGSKKGISLGLFGEDKKNYNLWYRSYGLDDGNRLNPSN